MTVNPKKLRPYDEPPKRRRGLIPGGPGTAAIGFGVMGALWLAAATGIGVLWMGLAVLNVPTASFPLGVFDLSFELSVARLEAAFVNGVVYGWLSNVAFAAICFFTPRLAGRTLAGERWANVGLALWNLSLLGGIAALYVFDAPAHYPLTAFPWLIDGGLATGAAIVSASFAVTAASALRGGYISLWYAAVALLALLGLLTINVGIGFFDFGEVATALTSAYVSRTLETTWVLGTAIATLYYVVPRASGNPLAIGGVALLGFVSWLLFAPLAGLARLVDTTVPYFVTTVGSVATILLLVPALLVAMNLVVTLRGRFDLLFGVNAGAYAVIGIAFLVASALLEAVGALISVSGLVGGTDWVVGAFVFTSLGAATFAGLGLLEHAMPRLLRREWGGGVLSITTLWSAFAGATLAGTFLIGGGIAEGSMLRQAAAQDAIAAALIPYRSGAFLGLGLVALAGLATIVNLFLMYSSGRLAPTAAPASATATAGAGH